MLGEENVKIGIGHLPRGRASLGHFSDPPVGPPVHDGGLPRQLHLPHAQQHGDVQVPAIHNLGHKVAW